MRVFVFVLALLAAGLPPAAAFAAPAAEPPPPSVFAGLKVELVDEGVNQDGRWFQTFRVTIRPGGTISDAAVAIYNDIGRSDDVFRAAQAKNPSLTNPAYVHVGTEIDITIDPTTVFVYRETQREQGGAVERIVYYNGVVETYYGDPKSGVLRTVDFPAKAPTESFTFPDAFRGTPEAVAAKPGTRIVDYRYVPGEGFADVVRKIFGVNSARAANDLLTQSGWDPNRWPPDGGQTRVVVNTQETYGDEKPAALDFAPADAAAREQWRRLAAERSAAGIYAVRVEREGIVYKVTVGDGSVTARRVARLLYNDEGKFLRVVAAAGLQAPTADSAGVPADYDPMLVGRSFELQVPFAEERFVLVNREPTGKEGEFVSRLANGTVIYEYEREPGQSGLLRLIYYPNGYKSIVSRPGGLTLGLLDFLHFQLVNIANSDLPREQRELLTREFQARMLWTWSRGIPRDAHDVAEVMRLNVSEDDTIFEVLTRRREAVPLAESVLFELWFTYPLVVAALVVTLGTVFLFALSPQARRIQESRRRGRIRRG